MQASGAPRGVDQAKWERCVLKIKKSGIDVDPHKVCTAALELDKALGSEAIEEAMTSLSQGPLLRPQKKMECQESLARVREAATDPSGRKIFKVTIICEGLGNLRDKNYYSEAAIKSGPTIYEGKKAYYNHPTDFEEMENPNRSVKDAIGHYENIKAELGQDGLWELNGDLVPVPNSPVISLLEHAVDYKKKYPDKDFVGISINGDGQGLAMDWDDFIKEVKPKPAAMEKLSQLEDQTINNITKLTDAVSADLVTEPGAGGKVTGLKESNQFNRREKMAELSGLMRKLFTGVEKKDEKLIEQSVEDVKKFLQSEDEAEDEDTSKEKREARDKEADSMVKHMLNVKKELKKEKDESEQEYEAKCMKQAYKQMKKEMEDEAKKEKKEAKQDKDNDDDDKKKEADKKKEKREKEKKEKDDNKEDEDDAGDDKGKKKSSRDNDDGDDDDDTKESEDDDGDDDYDDKKDSTTKSKNNPLISKMMKQIGQMKSKIEQMEDTMAKHEDEASKAKEEAVILKTEKVIRAREELIDGLLSKSGESRQITKLWRGVLQGCKSDKAIEEMVKKLTEAAAQVRAEEFEDLSSRGLVERAGLDDEACNDELFLK